MLLVARINHRVWWLRITPQWSGNILPLSNDQSERSLFSYQCWCGWGFFLVKPWILSQKLSSKLKHMAGCQNVGSWVRSYYPIYIGARFISILWAYHTFQSFFWGPGVFQIADKHLQAQGMRRRMAWNTVLSPKVSAFSHQTFQVPEMEVLTYISCM